MSVISNKSEVSSISEKLVYHFGGEISEGGTHLKNLLGGKGAGLSEMATLGIPVPPGFTITTEVCNAFYELEGIFPSSLKKQVEDAINLIENTVGSNFGDSDNPLLVSVRSGARVSMPGMMDTILNLGLNDDTASGLAKRSGNDRFAYDSYRRFVQMYGDVVLNIGKDDETDEDPFEALLEAKKSSLGLINDTDLDGESLKELVFEYKDLIRSKGGEFPEDPWEQLWGAIGAVFESWQNPRAVIYRNQYGYSDHWGTAVNVQAMVFGNLGEDCATGVLFTRNPSTGSNDLFGEFLVNAQGEDVVAGIRTPQPISSSPGEKNSESLEVYMPKIYQELLSACENLENHFGDMQDIEFTIQQDKLWILQTRNGKRSGLASLRIAVELVNEGLISKGEAINQIDAEQLNELLHPVFDPQFKKDVIAHGMAASPGAAVGRVVFTPRDVSNWVNRGESVILVRSETSPEDIEGMVGAAGILTARGGMTSHAAVVARGMGKCCVTGCANLEIDFANKQMKIVGSSSTEIIVNEGEIISLDGNTGEVILGEVATLEGEFPPEFDEIMSWVDDLRRLNIRANADTPEDAQKARAFGAEGIGLCRTEHMFFGSDRISAVRQMILANDSESRNAALKIILPIQRDDFIGILNAMSPYPVTIRLLDPPLHEFLPTKQSEMEELAAVLKLPVEDIERRVDSLREQNPMLGHRGVRLAMTFPEIYDIQVQAIIEAACTLSEQNVTVYPEIMIPLVGLAEELRIARERVVMVAESVIKEKGIEIEYSIGTMIELPRACVVADEIAQYADFFSFGTNDLTQTTLGLSRDDASKFLPAYIDNRILANDPFVRLETDGVGKLISLGIERVKLQKPDLKIGICGEHGGDPESINFFEQELFDYISCSPYRVPIARLAAAQAKLASDNLPS